MPTFKVAVFRELLFCLSFWPSHRNTGAAEAFPCSVLIGSHVRYGSLGRGTASVPRSHVHSNGRKHKMARRPALEVEAGRTTLCNAYPAIMGRQKKIQNRRAKKKIQPTNKPTHHQPRRYFLNRALFIGVSPAEVSSHR